MYNFTTTEQYYKDFFETLFPDTLSQALILRYDFIVDDGESLVLRILVDNTRDTPLPELHLEKDGIEKFAEIAGIPELLGVQKNLEIQLKYPKGRTPPLYNTKGWNVTYKN